MRAAVGGGLLVPGGVLAEATARLLQWEEGSEETSVALSRGLKMSREVTVVSGLSGTPCRWVRSGSTFPSAVRWPLGGWRLLPLGGDHERPLGRRC